MEKEKIKSTFISPKVVIETIPRTYVEWDEYDHYTGETVIHMRYERRDYGNGFICYINTYNTNTGSVIEGKFFDDLENLYQTNK